jgi:hypothetical protein
MEKKNFGSVEQKIESTQERGREQLRAKLARGAEPLVEGLGLTTKRNKGELFQLRLAETPRKSSRETLPTKPVTFDGFEAVGLSVDQARESLSEDRLNQMADSVRFSLQPAVKIVDGKIVVAQYVMQTPGHLRIDILPLDDHEMPSKQDIMDLLKYEAARVLRWRNDGISADEISLVLSSRGQTRAEWIDQAVASLLTHTMTVEEAKTKAVRIVDDVIAAKKKL